MESVLHAFEVLGDDRFHDVVLAPLLRVGAAGLLALSCKQFRQFCQSATRELCFSRDNCVPAPTNIVERFPNCSKVKLDVTDSTDLSVAFPPALAALARLPRLETLCLHVDVIGDAISEPGYFAVFLELVRVHLTSITSLDISIAADDVDWEDSNALWQVLSRFTRLHSLKMVLASESYYDPPEINLPLNDLRVLSSLSSLSSLSIAAGFIGSNQDYGFVSCLTSLTHLELPLILPSDEQPDPSHPNIPPHSCLSAFTTLNNLRSLTLIGRDVLTFSDPPFTAADCSSLAQLTALTKLQLDDLTGLDTQDLLQQLLRPLQQLQVLKLPRCKASVALPVLAGLGRLTELKLDWTTEASARRRGISSVVCPSVRCLRCEGPIPIEAFPEVQVLDYDGLLDANSVMKIIRTCKQLKELSMVSLPEPQHCTLKARRAALQSLSQLPHLRCLGVSVWDDKELEIIAELLRLRQLHLIVSEDYTVAGLLQLGKMKEQGQLQEMTVVNLNADLGAEEWEELRARLPINMKASLP